MQPVYATLIFSSFSAAFYRSPIFWPTEILSAVQAMRDVGDAKN